MSEYQNEERYKHPDIIEGRVVTYQYTLLHSVSVKVTNVNGYANRAFTGVVVKTTQPDKAEPLWKVGEVRDSWNGSATYDKGKWVDTVFKNLTK